MQALLTVLIIAAVGQTPTLPRYPEATTLYECSFDDKADTNFDQWPDAWTRRRGPGYPLYVGVTIQEQPGPGGNRVLQIDLDGGGAVALGPPITIEPTMACALETWVKTDGLKYDRACVSISFLDAKRQLLQTVESEKLGKTTPWTKLRVGPVTPQSDAARFAMVGLHLEPEIPEQREDLRGHAAFADVWLGHMPRIVLSTGEASNLFTDANQVKVECTTSGFVRARPVLRLELDDVLGRRLAEMERTAEPLPAPAGASGRQVVMGRATWKPPLSGAGFYRLHARVKGLDALYAQSLTIVVIEPLASVPGSPFGWNLPRLHREADYAQLRPLIAQAGLGWVKLPLWYAPAECGKALDPLMGFLERLPGIEPIGVLGTPPEEVRKRLADVRIITAADVFAAPAESWSPSLEAVMSRMAGRVRWWQLGTDHDLSFIDYPRLATRLQEARVVLSRLGGDLNLGIPWGWLNQFPATGTSSPPWQFLSLSADPSLTAEELACYLAASRNGRVLHFVELEPLPRNAYPLDLRAIDLVQRMVSGKIHGADAMFVPQPIGSQRGLLADDGTVGELFLPWRTVALLLGGANYVGSLELPGGSTNHVFTWGGSATLVVWNNNPVEEVLYFGDHVRQYDLWGRSSLPPTRAQGQGVAVGPRPIFLTGVNEPIARWRMAMGLTVRRIESVQGRPHDNVLQLKNTFSQAISGRATFVGQEGLVIEPRQFDFHLARGEAFQRPFQITLTTEAISGRHPLRVDFEVQAEQTYRFAAYRSIDVGLGDVYLEARTHLNARGDLVVEQEFFNTTSQKVTFRCQLFAPGRQLQTSDILDLATGRAVRTYLLPHGEELIGRSLWVRATEVGGPRVLNYRIAAER
jgi:hypothetical protein